MNFISKWYIIGGFFPLENELIYEILSSFINGKSKIVFQYYYPKYDKEDIETNEDVFELYCSGHFKHRDKKNDDILNYQVKELLFNQFSHFNDSDLSEEIIKENLFQELCNGDYSNINNITLECIKEFVCISFLEEKDKQDINFIEDRKVFENTIDVSFRKCDKIAKYVYYRCDNNEDLMKAIELQAIALTCIVTSDFKDFNNYDYVIEIFEQIDYVIAIKDCKNHFHQEIAPKIMKIMKENQKIEMEEEFLSKFSE